MGTELSPELRHLLVSMYELALCDNDYDETERLLILNFALEYGISPEELERIMQQPKPTSAIPQTIEERVRHLYILTQVAWADGTIKESERKVLRSYILRYQFLEENADMIVDYLITSCQEGKSITDIINELNS